VITIAHGRHGHLALQETGLAGSTRAPDQRVVVAMDDPTLDGPAVVHVPTTALGLPLARARNVGARHALELGADALVFLDVDCIPSPALLETYERALSDPVTSGDLLCGPVTYLPPAPAAGYDLRTLADLGSPHAARPSPAAGEVDRGHDRYDLFWSLSFALSAGVWRAIGGFDEAYVGYGGEDTDVARRAEAAGVAIAWVGGAGAFHQHHPVSRPPVEHVADIVRNATIFHARWGSWPMRGWLDAFVERGLVARRRDGSYVVASVLGDVLDREG